MNSHVLIRGLVDIDSSRRKSLVKIGKKFQEMIINYINFKRKSQAISNFAKTNSLNSKSLHLKCKKQSLRGVLQRKRYSIKSCPTLKLILSTSSKYLQNMRKKVLAAKSEDVQPKVSIKVNINSDIFK